MSAEIRTFRSTKYGDVYQFRYRHEGKTWAVIIEKHPHNPHGGSANETHILDGNRLCLTENPKTLERAIALSYTWIDYFSKYIRTGSTTQIDVRAHVKDEQKKK